MAYGILTDSILRTPLPPDYIYPGVSVEEVPGGFHTIDGVSTSVTAFVGTTTAGPVNKPVQCLSDIEFDRTFGGLDPTSEVSYAVRQFFNNDGKNAIIVRIDDAALAGPGVQALEDDAEAHFNLLCLPGITAKSALADAIGLCRRRRAFLIVDAPLSANTPDDLLAMAASAQLPRDDHAALYYPWVDIPDPLHPGQWRRSAPSGTIAGLYARIDITRGVWKAPAGTDARLKNVHSLARALTDAENHSLSLQRINCLRSFPGHGPVAWGARTLADPALGASQWEYVPVRRTALYIEDSLDRGLKWTAFEPNGESLWVKIRTSGGNFMQGRFAQVAFQGATPREAYFVKCDGQTTTQNDLDNGVVNILVGFAPLKAAEFVIIELQQIAGQVTSTPH